MPNTSFILPPTAVQSLRRMLNQQIALIYTVISDIPSTAHAGMLIKEHLPRCSWSFSCFVHGIAYGYAVCHCDLLCPTTQSAQ